MAKVNPHINQGTQYIQVSRLPFNQAIGIRKSISEHNMLTLETASGTVSDALEYSQYEYWFDFQYGSKEPEFEI